MKKTIMRIVATVFCFVLALTGCDLGLERATHPAEEGGVSRSLSGVKRIACGERHSMAITSKNALMATGDNRSGQLGKNVSNTTKWNSVLGNVFDMAGGNFHSLAVKRDGTLWVTSKDYA